MKTRWEWVSGDVDFVTFGGCVINHKTNELWYIEGINFHDGMDVREIEIDYWRDRLLTAIIENIIRNNGTFIID